MNEANIEKIYKSEDYFVLNNIENLKIQMRFFIPFHQKDENKNKLAVISHPHPLFGGTMQNNVVRAVRDAFIKFGISTVTFNFRGVGKSTGSFSNGIGEQNDLKIVINFLLEKGYSSIILAGYSFGAVISLAVSKEYNLIDSIILISYPFGFIKNISPNYELKISKLFIIGTQDDFVNLDLFKREYAKFTEPKRFSIISNSDHFYIGFEKKIEEIILQFLAEKK